MNVTDTPGVPDGVNVRNWASIIEDNTMMLAINASTIEDVVEHVRSFDRSLRPEYSVRQESGTHRPNHTSKRLDRWVVRDRDGTWCGSFRNYKHANYYASGLNDGKFHV